MFPKNSLLCDYHYLEYILCGIKNTNLEMRFVIVKHALLVFVFLHHNVSVKTRSCRYQDKVLRQKGRVNQLANIRLEYSRLTIQSCFPVKKIKAKSMFWVK